MPRHIGGEPRRLSKSETHKGALDFWKQKEQASKEAASQQSGLKGAAAKPAPTKSAVAASDAPVSPRNIAAAAPKSAEPSEFGKHLDAIKMQLAQGSSDEAAEMVNWDLCQNEQDAHALLDVCFQIAEKSGDKILGQANLHGKWLADQDRMRLLEYFIKDNNNLASAMSVALNLDDQFSSAQQMKRIEDRVGHAMQRSIKSAAEAQEPPPPAMPAQPVMARADSEMPVNPLAKFEYYLGKGNLGDAKVVLEGEDFPSENSEKAREAFTVKANKIYDVHKDANHTSRMFDLLNEGFLDPTKRSEAQQIKAHALFDLCSKSGKMDVMKRLMAAGWFTPIDEEREAIANAEQKPATPSVVPQSHTPKQIEEKAELLRQNIKKGAHHAAFEMLNFRDFSPEQKQRLAKELFVACVEKHSDIAVNLAHKWLTLDMPQQLAFDAAKTEPELKQFLANLRTNIQAELK